jgi:hypothetical protein
MRDTVKVVLDTNFLLIPGKFGVDIFSELDRVLDFPYRLYILENTIKELEKIKEKVSGAEKRAVMLAKSLIKTKNINIIRERPGFVDDVLAELGALPNTIIATLDSGLRKRLPQAIILRQKKYLRLEKKNVLQDKSQRPHKASS